jgi:hypothetical protein
LLVDQPLDLIHVNEALALPIGIEAARQTGAKVLFDAHEYTPLLEEDKLWGRLLAVPFHHYLIRQYAHHAVRGIGDDVTKVHTLVRAIVGRTGLSIGYSPEANKTARRVFREGKGNCMAYATKLVNREIALELCTLLSEKGMRKPSKNCGIC